MTFFLAVLTSPLERNVLALTVCSCCYDPVIEGCEQPDCCNSGLSIIIIGEFINKQTDCACWIVRIQFIQILADHFLRVVLYNKGIDLSDANPIVFLMIPEVNLFPRKKL